MTPDRRLLSGALGLSIILAACGGSSTGASPGTAAPGAGGTAATSTPSVATPTDAAASAAPEPTAVPPATEAASGGPGPSLVPGAASDLEAMLPDEVGGVTYQKSSFDGASLATLGAGIDTTQLDPILKASGKTINDVRVAIAAPEASADSGAGMVVAIQIKGIDAATFIQAMGPVASTVTRTSVGGKSVYKSGAGGYTVIVYPKGDVVFEVLLASDTAAEAIVSQLP